MIRHLIVVGSLLLSAASASAGVLKDFNLIAFGNVSGKSHVHGRSLIFGDIVKGTMDFAQDKLVDSGPVTPGASYENDGLILGGQLKTNIKVNNGNAKLKEAQIAGAKIDNAKTIYDADGVQAILDDARAEVDRLTSYFDTLNANSKTDLADMNNAKFITTPGKDGVAVFDLTEQVGQPYFFDRKNGGASLVGDPEPTGDLFLIKDDATSINFLSGLNLNMNEFNKASFLDRIVWYFPNATTVNVNGALNGALIAPNATIDFQSNITGTVVGNNVVLSAEIHLPNLALPPLPTVPPTPPTSAAPEPASIASFGVLLCAALAHRRHRRRAKRSQIA
ncbi:collagen-binding domain-containing protein [Allorhodopirellula solitaria]|uniref:Choice-of-anchor A domain-containing protein n=1 Tax=Allorhodopirellula solitaria TaxID=2527987 RepID=A0A5C5XQN4_9BACT|nr:collagen-binding domain-containing protein [Allorhodopirellula solitaria]TWT64723.1 hypothetical protein CA85_35080 [Allorhodopirellula solitaria]